MIVRFIFFKLLEAMAALVGIILFPLVYQLRFKIVNNRKLFKRLGLFYLTNADEPNFWDNWYGLYELVDGKTHIERVHVLMEMNRFQRFVLSYRWVAFRNPTWEFKHLISQHVVGDKEGISVVRVSGYDDGMTWRNKFIHGMQYATYFVNGVKMFRFSFTIPLISGYYWNLMLGAGDHRYISKFRIFKD